MAIYATRYRRQRTYLQCRTPDGTHRVLGYLQRWTETKSYGSGMGRPALAAAQCEISVMDARIVLWARAVGAELPLRLLAASRAGRAGNGYITTIENNAWEPTMRARVDFSGNVTRFAPLVSRYHKARWWPRVPPLSM